MKKNLITFSGGVYDETTRLIVENGRKFGADLVWVYDDLWLMKQPFYEINAWLWEHPQKRGFGWYCWKPFIIMDALATLQPGDIVFYTDADCYPIADLSKLFELCDRDGLMVFEDTAWPDARNWCKADCYCAMGIPSYLTIKSAVARYCLFRCGHWQAWQFLMEWLTYSLNRRCNTFDASSILPEVPDFREHRCEQSILTLLAHRYGLYLWRSLCESGFGSPKDRENYGQVMSQTNIWNAGNGGKNLQAPVTGSKYANVG